MGSRMPLSRFARIVPFLALVAACSAKGDPVTLPGSGVGGADNVGGGASGGAVTGGTGVGGGVTGGEPGMGGTGVEGTGGAGNGAGNGPVPGAGGDPPVVTPGSYALPPPDQCINTYYVDGCTPGDAGSTCGGWCTPPSAGTEEGKPGEWGYACPRFMMLSDEMNQAASDDASTYGWSADGTSPFNYAVAGHDFNGAIDSEGKSVCCQCYQLVPYGPAGENQILENGSGALMVPPPKPLIVQVFNTGATTESFDIYLGVGGVGAVNACMDPTRGGPAMYSAYPSIGQPNDGGVKAAGNPGNGTACKNQYSLVTAETLGSSGCVSWVEEHCGQVVHDQDWITQVTRRSCIETNQPNSLYKLNWEVYVKRVACPVGLTQVTGCKIVEDQPPVDPTVTTPAAAQSAGFQTGFHTTSMQDCAKPSCAARDWVTSKGHTTDGHYNSFYTCNRDGVPWTE